MLEDESDSDLQEIDQSVIEHDRLIFDLISGRNTVEFERSNILDSKASNMIGFVGITIGLLTTLISFIFNQRSLNSSLSAYYGSYRVLLLGGITVLGLSIISSLFVYFIKEYRVVPETNHLIEEYAKKNESTCNILRITSKGISDAIIKNRETNDQKATWVKYSLIFYGVGMGFVVIFICGLLIV